MSGIGSGWEEQRARLTGIQRYHQEKNLGLVTSHGYSSYPGTPFNTDVHVYVPEAQTLSDTLDMSLKGVCGLSADETPGGKLNGALSTISITTGIHQAAAKATVSNPNSSPFWSCS